MSLNQVFQIHLDKILQEKAPRMAKKMPRFLVKWMMKIVHQDDCNEALRYIGDETGVEAMSRLVEYFNLTLYVEGLDNIPGDRKFIFASNHPLGGLDGICLSAIVGKKYDHQIKYIVNDILYFIKPLQPIFIPINKHGAQSKRSAQLINDAFESENQVITFPAGFCSRKSKGRIEDPEWKKMVVLKAVEYQRDIIPVYFVGHNSRFFYWLASVRKKLKLKLNIEMLFLPAEMFKQRNASFTIRFGDAIPWQTFDNSKNPQQWTNWIKSVVYQMEK